MCTSNMSKRSQLRDIERYRMINGFVFVPNKERESIQESLHQLKPQTEDLNQKIRNGELSDHLESVKVYKENVKLCEDRLEKARVAHPFLSGTVANRDHTQQAKTHLQRAQLAYSEIWTAREVNDQNTSYQSKDAASQTSEPRKASESQDKSVSAEDKATQLAERSDDSIHRKLDQLLRNWETCDKDKQSLVELEEKLQAQERELGREREEGKKKSEDIKKLTKDNECLKRQLAEKEIVEEKNRSEEEKRHEQEIQKIRSMEQDLRKQSEQDIHKKWKKLLPSLSQTNKQQEQEIERMKQSERWLREQVTQLTAEKLCLEDNILTAKACFKQWRNTIQCSSASTQSHSDILEKIEQLQTELNIGVHVQEADENWISQLDPTDVYNMTSSPKGTVTLINVRSFSVPHLDTRRGSEHDEWNLKQLFTEMSFKVRSHRNPTKQEMLKIMDEANREVEPANAASIVVVMSHGTEGIIYAADGQKVFIQDDLKAKICRTLPGKPKMLIVCACLGSKATAVHCLCATDVGVEEARLSQPCQELGPVPDMPATKLQTHACTDRDHCTGDGRQPIPEIADVITAYSTVHGYKSYRDRTSGSPFIQNLVLEFADHSHDTTVQEMLRKVRLRMCNTYPELCVQVPQHESTLRLKWFLMPGRNLLNLSSENAEPMENLATA